MVVPKAPRSFDEPMQKRLIVSAAKRAAVQLWGDDGLNEIAQALPDDTREEFFRVVQVDDWIAVRHFIRWMYVAHHGPAKLSLPRIGSTSTAPSTTATGWFVARCSAWPTRR